MSGSRKSKAKGSTERVYSESELERKEESAKESVQGVVPSYPTTKEEQERILTRRCRQQPSWEQQLASLGERQKQRERRPS